MRKNIGIIGAGKIGTLRAQHLPKYFTLVGVFDTEITSSKKLAQSQNCRHSASPEDLFELIGDFGAVIIATPHNQLSKYAKLAIESNLHLFIEKPGSISVGELRLIKEMAELRKLTVAIGYNKRFHPSIQELKAITEEKRFGELKTIRTNYGHGGRPGYELEWRAKKELSGGGELLDQGSHLLDLVKFLSGDVQIEAAKIFTNYWDIKVEDNVFAFGSGGNNCNFMMTASWTEWKNLFRLEVFYENAKVEINGLGGSYGMETLTIFHMENGLGIPSRKFQQFDTLDISWKLELEDFRRKLKGRKGIGSDITDAIKVLSEIEKVYKRDHR